MPGIEQNINRRALIYGINMLGSALFISGGIFCLEDSSNEVFLFFLFAFIGWAWWNFIHGRIFKGIPYFSMAGLSFIIFVFTAMLSAGFLSFFHLYLPWVFDCATELRDMLITLSVIFGCYILCMEGSVYFFKKFHKI